MSSVTQRVRPLSALRWPALVACFAGAYLALAVLSLGWGDAPRPSPWFLPAGLSLAAVLLLGRQAVPIIVVADWTQMVVRGTESPVDALAMAVAQGVLWGAVGLVIRSRSDPRSGLRRLDDVVRFVVVGVGLGSVAGAFVAYPLSTALSSSGWSWEAALTFGVGDAIGVLAVTPVVLALARGGWHIPTPQRPTGELAALTVLLLAAPAAGVRLAGGELLALAVVPLVWLALRRGMPAASLAVLAWSASAVAAFQGSFLMESFTETSAVLVSGATLSLLIGAAVTEREHARSRLAYLSMHDDETGLENERGLDERLVDAVSHGARGETALVFVQLGIAMDDDGLRDEVLARAVDRMRRLTGPDVTLARVAGLQFVALVEGPAARRVDGIASAIEAGLSRPLLFGGREYLLDPATGVARGPELAAGADLVDVARRRAVDDVASTTAAPERPLVRHESRRIARELSSALADDQLDLEYQPIVDSEGGGVIGAEALLRWRRADGREVGPATFVPVAERRGLILPIGRWTIARACEEAVAWQGTLERVGIHVNLSPIQLKDDGLLGHIDRVLERTGLDPSLLCFEMTETALIADVDAAARRLRELGARGIGVVLDDFGTGASSLQLLQQLPVTALKVDRSFVRGIEESSVDWAIVGATLGLARALGLASVAEGVETTRQQDVLLELGCDALQGYLLSRPLDAERFVEWSRPRGSAASRRRAPGAEGAPPLQPRRPLRSAG